MAQRGEEGVPVSLHALPHCCPLSLHALLVVTANTAPLLPIVTANTAPRVSIVAAHTAHCHCTHCSTAAHCHCIHCCPLSLQTLPHSCPLCALPHGCPLSLHTLPHDFPLSLHALGSQWNPMGTALSVTPWPPPGLRWVGGSHHPSLGAWKEASAVPFNADPHAELLLLVTKQLIMVSTGWICNQGPAWAPPCCTALDVFRPCAVCRGGREGLVQSIDSMQSILLKLPRVALTPHRILLAHQFDGDVPGWALPVGCEEGKGNGGAVGDPAGGPWLCLGWGHPWGWGIWVEDVMGVQGLVVCMGSGGGFWKKEKKGGKKGENRIK